METTFEKAEQLTEDLKDYLDNKIDALKFKTAEKTSIIIANLIAGAIVLLVFLFVIIFASISLSYILASYLGRVWLGFLIVALLFLIIGAIVWFARGRLIRLPIMNSIIQQLFNTENDEDD